MNRSDLYIGNRVITHRYIGDKLLVRNRFGGIIISSPEIFRLKGENRIKITGLRLSHRDTDNYIIRGKVISIVFRETKYVKDRGFIEFDHEIFNFERVESLNEHKGEYYVYFKDEATKDEATKVVFEDAEIKVKIYDVDFNSDRREN